MESWCTIESDPGVFTELISSFGVKNVQVDEIYSLDQLVESQSYGLIFLFKWKKETDLREPITPELLPDLFFAQQVITNACATQAILSVLLNSPDIDLGSSLSEFKAFTMAFDAECKGLAISNSDMIREAHNSFARSDPFEIDDTKAPTGKGHAHHFIAFVPFQESVFELDGLKSGPIHLGDYNKDAMSWLDIARPAIEERMARYSASETHFVLLSLGPKKSTVLEQQINDLQSRLNSLELVLSTGEGLSSHLNDGYQVGNSVENVTLQREEISNTIVSLTSELEEEHKKIKRQSEENIRRKHNYLPFISRLVEVLAAKGHLKDLIQSAQDAVNERRNNNGKREREGEEK